MGKAKIESKILKIACILCGLMLINLGLNIFFRYMPMPQMSKELMSVFGLLMHVKWLLPLVFIIEIVGGIRIILSTSKGTGSNLTVTHDARCHDTSFSLQYIWRGN